MLHSASASTTTNPTYTAYTPQVSAWSSDGQEILLEIGFYYRLPKDNLINLYLEIGGTDNGHDDVVNKLDHLVLNIAAETFRHVSTKFETRQFFTERLAVKEAMHQELVARLETFQITVPRFQLLDIDVPASFADAVEGVCKVQHRCCCCWTPAPAVNCTTLPSLLYLAASPPSRHCDCCSATPYPSY